MVIIMLVVMFNYRTFSDNLALSSAGQEIAIELRQAQIYGLSVKEGAVGGNIFSYGYGIYVEKSDPLNYILFVDKNNDNKYDTSSVCPGGTECVEKVPIRNGVKISDICWAPFGGGFVCPSAANVQSMDVLFLRPNPDVGIRFLVNVPPVTLLGTYQTGRIVLTSPLGKTMTVSIQNTGQISVQ